ncbi:MAG: hypothetical protein EZS28_047603, partial [Streblomastix strix]
SKEFNSDTVPPSASTSPDPRPDSFVLHYDNMLRN